MARPKSEDKRNSILSAAIHVFAERGLGAAPTSEISKRAGVAEGTLFTYFKTKDDLINTLYCETKLDVASAVMSRFPPTGSTCDKLMHIWKSYIDWGVCNPQQRKVLAQLMTSDALTAASIEAGMVPFVEIDAMIREAIEMRVVRDDLPLEFMSKTLMALAEATMELIEANPSLADKYRTSGFEMFWAGIARK